jgi:NADH:ubiquinone oxidoreductase subunit B-like Fe-S oxidoreductase
MDKQVQVIEQTSKRWKALRLWSLLVFSIGCCTSMGTSVGPDHGGDKFGMVGALIMLCSLCMYIYSRAAAWWHHG